MCARCFPVIVSHYIKKIFKCAKNHWVVSQNIPWANFVTVFKDNQKCRLALCACEQIINVRNFTSKFPEDYFRKWQNCKKICLPHTVHVTENKRRKKTNNNNSSSSNNKHRKKKDEPEKSL